MVDQTNSELISNYHHRCSLNLLTGDFSPLVKEMKRVAPTDLSEKNRHNIVLDPKLGRHADIWERDLKVTDVTITHTTKNESFYRDFALTPPLLVPPLLSRFSLGSGFEESFSYIYLLEKLISFEVTQRTALLRTLFLELERINGHLTSLATIVTVTESCEVLSNVTTLKQIMNDIYQRLLRGNDLSGLLFAGTVTISLSHDWQYHLVHSLLTLKRESSKLLSRYSRDRLQFDRLSSCTLTKTEAMEFGLSGVSLRASGVKFDLRKVTPFYFYKDLSFEVPLGVYGTIYERQILRVMEILQSVDIIMTLVDNISVTNSDDKNRFKNFFDALMNGESHHVDSNPTPFLIEGTNSIHGFVLSLQGDLHENQNEEFKIGSLQRIDYLINGADAFCSLARGKRFDDLQILYHSLN